MRTILFFASNSQASTRAKLDGVYRYASSAGWKIQAFDSPIPTHSIVQLIDFWNASGCIVECGSLKTPPPKAAFGKTPVVYLDANPKEIGQSHNRVLHDSESDGRLAAKELLSIGCKTFAYVSHPGDPFWSRDREAAFLRYLRLNGKTFFRFKPQHTKLEENLLAEELKLFISGLPVSCGIFAANDYVAAKLASICALLKRSIPDDCALVSVDNDEMVCENARVPISSIAPDFSLGGYLSAKLLDKNFHKRRQRPQTLTFGPIALVRRESTTRHHVKNKLVLRALSQISAANGRTTPSEVVATLNCSRRLAELRFRESTGKSILQHIDAVRLENAFAVLRQKHIPLSDIPERVGYHSQSAFDKFFRQQTGFSPSVWRKKN